MTQAIDLPANAKRFYTVPEAAELLRCSAAHLYRLIAAGTFPVVELGNRKVVPVKVLDDMEKDAMAAVNSSNQYMH